jgi:hypothetical protein
VTTIAQVRRRIKSRHCKTPKSITSRRRSGWLHTTASGDAMSMRSRYFRNVFGMRLGCV